MTYFQTELSVNEWVHACLTKQSDEATCRHSHQAVSAWVELAQRVCRRETCAISRVWGFLPLDCMLGKQTCRQHTGMQKQLKPKQKPCKQDIYKHCGHCQVTASHVTTAWGQASWTQKKLQEQ